MPPEIQIAFQGGGAKFIAMLPVTEAFQACEKAGRIKIKAVAGTSAGALCAALLAADCDFPRLKTYLAAAGPAHVQNLLGPDYQQLTRLLKAKWYEKIPTLFSSGPVLRNIFYTGSPVLYEEEFGQFLDKMLDCCALGKYDISLLPCRLSIVTTHLTKAKGETYTAGSLKEALRDSCALPLAFRSFAALTTTHYVDGGLSDNLPVESLIGDVTAPIFAVYPEETAGQPPINTLFSYMLALFSATIENNVKRAKNNISEPFRIPVKTNYSTFGFLEAIAQLNDDNWYAKILNETKNTIINFSSNYGILQSRNQVRFTDTNTQKEYAEALERLSRDYEDNFEHNGAQMIVKMNCAEKLTESSDTTNRPAENIRKVIRLKVISDNFRCYRASAAYGKHAGPSIWKAYNVTRDHEVPIRVLSLDVPFKGHVACLVEFVDAEQWLSKGEEIAISSVYYEKDCLKKLNMGKPDFIGTANPFKHVIGKTEVILMYPKALGPFTMKFNPGMSNIDKATTEVIWPTMSELDDGTVGIVGMKCTGLPPDGRFYTTVYPEVS